MTHLRAVEASETTARRSAGRRIVVIANREPYSHQWQEDGTCRVERPASGLVTAMEPILSEAGGTWIAHASGSADHAFASAGGRIAVPPSGPSYTLQRVWLQHDVYQRYYAGLANEALWPLCHNAFVKPLFRHADWEAYRAVNDVFARAAVAEIGADTNVLVQDYHFALVPDLIRRRSPLAMMNLFWHIPFPHPEIFGIFPWKEELLRGMLGADVVGFHTRKYCLNFLESVERYLRCSVDIDAMKIVTGGRSVAVRQYPISIEWPYPAASRIEGARRRAQLGIASDVHVSIAVDRIDYTKGLIERLDAVEHFLEQNPAMHERYVLVQVASPSRTGVPAYQQLSTALAAAAERINARFQTPRWKPVHLLVETLPPEEVRTYYAMADSAIVTPLHDGMNLVAKEYVASCEDGDGVLILSDFAGAAGDLDRALLVNPFDVQAVAGAMLRAVRMPPGERRARIASMRTHLAAHSIHEWSQRIVSDLDALRRPRTAGRSRAAGLRGELAL
jgi:trehalose-6-phosphate synthase